MRRPTAPARATVLPAAAAALAAGLLLRFPGHGLGKRSPCVLHPALGFTLSLSAAAAADHWPDLGVVATAKPCWSTYSITYSHAMRRRASPARARLEVTNPAVNAAGRLGAHEMEQFEDPFAVAELVMEHEQGKVVEPRTTARKQSLHAAAAQATAFRKNGPENND